jgi:predicted MFS family arabinose efflux permease
MFYGASGARDRDLRMTIHESIVTAGQILGALAGGVLYQALSMRAAFLFIAALCVAGIVLVAVLLRTRCNEV